MKKLNLKNKKKFINSFNKLYKIKKIKYKIFWKLLLKKEMETKNMLISKTLYLFFYLNKVLLFDLRFL